MKCLGVLFIAICVKVQAVPVAWDDILDAGIDASSGAFKAGAQIGLGVADKFGDVSELKSPADEIGNVASEKDKLTDSSSKCTEIATKLSKISSDHQDNPNLPPECKDIAEEILKSVAGGEIGDIIPKLLKLQHKLKSWSEKDKDLKPDKVKDISDVCNHIKDLSKQPGVEELLAKKKALKKLDALKETLEKLKDIDELKKECDLDDIIKKISDTKEALAKKGIEKAKLAKDLPELSKKLLSLAKHLEKNKDNLSSKCKEKDVNIEKIIKQCKGLGKKLPGLAGLPTPDVGSLPNLPKDINPDELKSLDCGKKLKKLDKIEDVTKKIPSSVGKLAGLAEDLKKIKKSILEGKISAVHSLIGQVAKKLKIVKNVLDNDELQKKLPEEKLQEMSEQCSKACDLLNNLKKSAGKKTGGSNDKNDESSDGTTTPGSSDDSNGTKSETTPSDSCEDSDESKSPSSSADDSNSTASGSPDGSDGSKSPSGSPDDDGSKTPSGSPDDDGSKTPSESPDNSDGSKTPSGSPDGSGGSKDDQQASDCDESNAGGSTNNAAGDEPSKLLNAAFGFLPSFL